MKALVTGAEGGIGRAICARLEAEGYEVERLDLVTGFDVADPGAWERVGRVDVACLNAGITTARSEVAELADEEIDRVLRVNVLGVVYGVRRLARVMEDGAIVATASLAGLMEIPVDPIYGLSKHAVIGFVRSAAPQLRPRLNAVCPGIVDTPMIDESRDSLLAAGFPLLRPEEIAEAVWIAATSEERGQAWVVQPGREPLRFRWPGVPGPRVAGAVGMRPPL